jgi:hypothetical protein
MLNFVYVWCLARLDPKDHENWKADLMAPLDPENPTEAEQEAEGELFMQSLAVMGGKK